MGNTSSSSTNVIYNYVSNDYYSFSSNTVTLNPIRVNTDASSPLYDKVAVDAGFWTFLNKDTSKLTIVVSSPNILSPSTNFQELECAKANSIDLTKFICNYQGVNICNFNGTGVVCAVNLYVNTPACSTDKYFYNYSQAYTTDGTVTLKAGKNEYLFCSTSRNQSCCITYCEGIVCSAQPYLTPQSRVYLNPEFCQGTGIISNSNSYIAATIPVSIVTDQACGSYDVIPTTNNYCSILKTVEKALNGKRVIYDFPTDVKMTNFNYAPKVHFDWFVNPSGSTAAPVPSLQINFFQVPMWNKNPYLNSTKLQSDADISIQLPAPKYDEGGKSIRRYVKVTRLSHETLSALMGKRISLNKVTEIIPQRFSYPFSAIVGTKIDSRAFAQVPTRTFDCKLKKVLVPSNYFPLNEVGEDVRYLKGSGIYRIYDGDWDGTFKLMWTNNPAWVLMDILINKRYGLGNYIESEQVDIWELYKIARWCDAVDERGYFYGVTSAEGGVEPRHAFNGIIQDKFNVFDMINQVASTFRGHVYYMNSMITFDDDRIKPIIGEFNNSDVKDGLFTYTNLQKDQEFTAAEVAFLDATDNFKPKIEYVEDSDAIRKRGILKKSINAYGVTSRGQARRLGRHFLYQTAKENMNASFTTDSRALLYKPGDLVGLNDELVNSVKNFGSLKKIEDIDTTSFKIVIDKVLDSGIYETGEISLYTPLVKPNSEDMLLLSQSAPKSISMCLPLPLDNMTYCDFLSGVTVCNSYQSIISCCFFTGTSQDSRTNTGKYFYYNVTGLGTIYLKPSGATARLATLSLHPNFDESPSHYGAYSFTGVTCVQNVTYSFDCYKLVCTILRRTPTGTWVDLVSGVTSRTSCRPLCTGTSIVSVQLQYVKDYNIKGEISNYGHWKMLTGVDSVPNFNFSTCSDVTLFDVSNEELKDSLLHRPYLFEHFDTGKYMQYTGSSNNGTPLYYDAKVCAANSISSPNGVCTWHSVFNYPHTYISQLRPGSATCRARVGSVDGSGYLNFNGNLGFQVSCYSSAALKYSDVIENDRPSIETFYVNSFCTGSYVDANSEKFNEYSEIILTKSGKSLVDGSYSGIKDSVRADLTSLVSGSSYSLKVLNKTQPIFKIMSIAESYINEYSVMTTQYRPEKFKEIEENNSIDVLENTFNFLSAFNSATKVNAAGSLNAPIITAVNLARYQNGSTLEIKWSIVDGADRYRIFIKTPSNQTQNVVTEVLNSSYDASNSTFIYNYNLPAVVEVGTYTVYLEALASVPNNSMYKFSPQSARTVSVLSY